MFNHSKIQVDFKSCASFELKNCGFISSHCVQPDVISQTSHNEYGKFLVRTKWAILSTPRSLSSSYGWASSFDGLDVDGVDFKPASDVIIQDQHV